MTEPFEVEKKCAVCGKISEHIEILSTNASGSPDLDTRPPEMERSTIDTWIQTCPLCGYCAPNISKRSKKLPEIVHGDSYQQQLNNKDFPKLANAFLCFSLIQENIGKYARAGWSAIHAAWSCDDEGFVDGAKKCREKAVILLQKAKETSQSFDRQTGGEEAIMVDLLRRSGQFEVAIKICDDGLKKGPKKIISDILQFQKILISKCDTTGHTIAEPTGDNE